MYDRSSFSSCVNNIALYGIPEIAENRIMQSFLECVKFFFLTTHGRHGLLKPVIFLQSVLSSDSWTASRSVQLHQSAMSSDHLLSGLPPSTIPSITVFSGLSSFILQMPLHPPLDNIRVMVIVWRLRGNIVRTAVWWILWHNVHVSAAHLREQFLQVQQIGFVTLGPLHCA